MFICNGLSLYNLTFLHLANHAFFKALLFLSAGSLIHAFFDEQDMRRMGQLRKVLPFTYVCFLIGSLAIMGFPFLTGFYSKDLILEFAYSRFIIDSLFVYFLSLISAVFTAIYSLRLIFFVFFNKENSNGFLTYLKSYENHDVACSWQMYISMFLLAVASIFIGYILSDLVVGSGNFYWNNTITLLPDHFSFIDTEFIHPIIKNLPVILSLSFMYFTWIFLNRIATLNKLDHIIYSKYAYFYPFWNILFSFFYHACFFNNIYNELFLNIFKISYTTTNKYLDKGFFEHFNPSGSQKIFYFLHHYFQNSWTPVIFLNVFFIFLAVCVFSCFFILCISYLHILLIKYVGLIPLSIFFIFIYI